MTTTAIREKLHNLINTADDNQVKAVYSIFQDQIAEKYDHYIVLMFVGDQHFFKLVFRGNFFS